MLKILLLRVGKKHKALKYIEKTLPHLPKLDVRTSNQYYYYQQNIEHRY